MILKTLTSIINSDYNSTYDFSYSINDTFISGNSIYFSCPISSILTDIGLSLNLSNISNFNLHIRVSSSLTENTFNDLIFEDIINLKSSNIVNNSLLVELTNLNSKFTHDYLVDVCSLSDVFNLYKNYKISFRINLSANNSLGDLNINSTDYLQDINFCLNTIESGPYDVGFKQIDLVNPNEFNESERYSIFNDNTCLIGGETVRCFYPKNIPNNTKSPLVVMIHGQAQLAEGYDIYLSSLASYGYFCISLYVDQEGKPGNVAASTFAITTNTIYSIKILNLFKNNLNKILNGLFFNKIDFNKITLIGHSRGGAAANAIILALKNKSGSYSVIQDTNISYSDIKCYINFAGVNNINVTTDGLFLESNLTLNVNNIQESQISYFSQYIDVPYLLYKGLNEDVANSDLGYNINAYISGFSYDIKRNKPEMCLLIDDFLDHSRLANHYGNFGANSGSNLLPSIITRQEKSYTYNTFINSHNISKSNIIYFIGVHNFNSNKIKKIRYNKNKNYKILSSKEIPLKDVFYNDYSDLKYIIDSYQGITSSMAGTTGFTFSSIGFTYDYITDSNITGITANLYLNLGFTYDYYCKELRCSKSLFTTGADTTLLQNKFANNQTTFNAVFGMYKGLFLPIQSNFNAGYTFSTGLTFSENDYFCIRGSLVLKYDGTSGITLNKVNQNFICTLYDSNNNFATLSSKMYSDGFRRNSNSYVSELYSNANSLPAIPTDVYFRVGDFNLKNNSLGITNINKILLQFGPDYGSTFAHLALDEFVVIKEL